MRWILPRQTAWLICALVVFTARPARAVDISGTVARTIVLTEDSRLVGDVTCVVTGAPCISFGAPNLTLQLNGFDITGQANPSTGCGGTNVANEVGITTNGQANAGIRGPGLVQRFKADGILFQASSHGWVQGVTVTTNCLAGIRINPTSSGISVEGNVAVRNGNASSPCGGI